MKHATLFSGIGGPELAASWLGWENAFHCEINDFGRKVLEYYWPESDSYNDITKTNFKKYANKIDVLTGGFPCQPYSLAGKRKGKEDERHLWPEMLRAIREIQPRWIVGENVFGLVNWSEGLVFEEVQTDLENEGYKVQSFILPAAGVNAPHKRERIFIVAYADKQRRNERISYRQKRRFQREQKRNNSKNKSKRNRWISRVGSHGCYGFTTNANGNGRIRKKCYKKRHEINARQNSQGIWSAYTGEPFGQGGYGANKTKPANSRGIQIRRDVQKNKIAEQRKICKISKNSNNKKKSSRNNRQQKDIDRSLVQNGHKSQFSVNRGLGKNKALFKRYKIRSRVDSFRVDRMDFKKRLSTNANGIGRQRQSEWKRQRTKVNNSDNKTNFWQNFPTQPAVCGRDDGLSLRLDGITFPKWRNESIKAYGNAIVPQVIYQIYLSIAEYETI